MWGDKEGGRLVESPLERWQPWAREPGRQGLVQGLCRVGEVGGGAIRGETCTEWGVFPIFLALSVKQGSLTGYWPSPLQACQPQDAVNV